MDPAAHAKEATVPVAYPVEVVLLYADYEPFGEQTTKGFTQLYHYGSTVEAYVAERGFKILLSTEDESLWEVNRPFHSGVVFYDTLNNPNNVVGDLREQVTNWKDAGGGFEGKDLTLGRLFHGLQPTQMEEIVEEARKVAGETSDPNYPDDSHFIQAAKNLDLEAHIIGTPDLSLGGLFHGLSQSQAEQITKGAKDINDLPDGVHYVCAAKILGLEAHIIDHSQGEGLEQQDLA
jgi:hypothetical protein